jgi:hypothetical protein
MQYFEPKSNCAMGDNGHNWNYYDRKHALQKYSHLRKWICQSGQKGKCLNMFRSHTLSMSNNYVQLGAQIASIP